MAAPRRGRSERHPLHRIDSNGRGCADRVEPGQAGRRASHLRVDRASAALCRRGLTRRAQQEQARLEARSSELARTEADATLRTEIVRRSLDASQRRIAILLRQLYIQGEPDPIAVILGATSIDEVVTGIEGLTRATAQNERLAREAAEKGQRLTELRTALAAQRERLDSAREAARAGTARLAAAVSGQRETVARIRRQAALTQQRLAALQAQGTSGRAALRRPHRCGSRIRQRGCGIRARRDDLRRRQPSRCGPRPRDRDPHARRRRRRLPPARPHRERPAGRGGCDRRRPDA